MPFNPHLQVPLPDAARPTNANETQAMLIHESPNCCAAQVEPLAHFLNCEELV